MKQENFWIYLIIMAGTTYFIRVIPFILCRGKVKSRFLKSFLAYVPYTVLGAMTFPAIFYATTTLYSAIAGLIITIIQALRKKSLIVVALSACITVFLIELL
ncbi:MAG: AzlD domain-containing protein [Acetivibrio sp.]